MMLPNSLAIVNAETHPAHQHRQLFGCGRMQIYFYLTGGGPGGEHPLALPGRDRSLKHRERPSSCETNDHIAIWEGHKLTKQQARERTGIKNVHWLSEFPMLLRRLMCECEHVYLNSNEHKRAVIEVETRDARFIRDLQQQFPLHSYQRLARLMHPLRVVKSPAEIEMMRQACRLTERGFRRVLRFVEPGVNEMEVEAEFAQSFIRVGEASPTIQS